MKLTNDNKPVYLGIDWGIEELFNPTTTEAIAAQENLAWKITAQRIVDREYRKGTFTL